MNKSSSRESIYFAILFKFFADCLRSQTLRATRAKSSRLRYCCSGKSVFDAPQLWLTLLILSTGLVKGCGSDSDFMSMGPYDTFEAYFENPRAEITRVEGRLSTFQEVCGQLLAATSAQHPLAIRDRSSFVELTPASIQQVVKGCLVKGCYPRDVRGRLLRTSEIKESSGMLNQSSDKTENRETGFTELIQGDLSEPVDNLGLIDAVNEYMKAFPNEIRRTNDICKLKFLSKGRVSIVVSSDQSHGLLTVR